MCDFRVSSILGPVHTYPDILESATFPFRIRPPTTRIRRIRQRIWTFLNPLSRVEKNTSATNPIMRGRVNLDSFDSDYVANLCSASYRTISQYGCTTATTGKICRNYGTCSEHILLQRSPGYYSESGYHRMRVDRWIRHTLRVDGETFESGKKKLRIKKYPDACGRGLII